MSVAIGSFADTLREALEQRGLALHRVRDRLGHRGVVVSVATLSYWQSGRSRPTRRSSMAALPHLEAVLALAPGTLARTLPPGPERIDALAVPELASLWPDLDDERVLRQLDTSWDTALDRLVVHDVLRVGADRRVVSLTTRQVLRASADGPDRRVVLHQQSDCSVPLPEFRALRGCSLGRVVRSVPDGVVGAELLFTRPLARGDTVVLEHEMLSSSPGPLERRHGRRARTGMREYCLEVEFHPDTRPSRVNGYEGDETWPVALDGDHRVHLVRSDATTGSTGAVWEWPDDTPVQR